MMRDRSFLLGMLTGAALLGVGLLIGRAGRPALAQDRPAMTDEAGKAETVPLIRAERIEIVDEVGTAQVVLGSNAIGGSISLRDRLGSTRLAASATRDGAAMAISHASTKNPVATLAASPTGSTFRLLDPAGKAMVELSRDEQGGLATFSHAGGEPALRIGGDDAPPTRLTASSIDGRPIYRFGADEHDAGLLTLHDPATGSPLIRLASRDGEAGEITTADQTGRPIAAIAASPDGEGQIFTFGAEGRLLIALAPISTGGAIRVHDPAGETAITIEIGPEGLPRIGVRDSDGGVRWIRP